MKRINWKLKVLMAERDIDSASELGRRLASLGLVMSSNQMARLVAKMPARLNMELLEGILTVLDCEPNELFEIIDDDGPVEFTKKPPRKKAAPSAGNKPAKPKQSSTQAPNVVDIGSISGPSFGALPVKPRD